MVSSLLSSLTKFPESTKRRKLNSSSSSSSPKLSLRELFAQGLFPIELRLLILEFHCWCNAEWDFSEDTSLFFLLDHKKFSVLKYGATDMWYSDLPKTYFSRFQEYAKYLYGYFRSDPLRQLFFVRGRANLSISFYIQGSRRRNVKIGHRGRMIPLSRFVPSRHLAPGCRLVVCCPQFFRGETGMMGPSEDDSHLVASGYGDLVLPGLISYEDVGNGCSLSELVTHVGFDAKCASTMEPNLALKTLVVRTDQVLLRPKMWECLSQKGILNSIRKLVIFDASLSPEHFSGESDYRQVKKMCTSEEEPRVESETVSILSGDPKNRVRSLVFKRCFFKDCPRAFLRTGFASLDSFELVTPMSRVMEVDGHEKLVATLASATSQFRVVRIDDGIPKYPSNPLELIRQRILGPARAYQRRIPGSGLLERFLSSVAASSLQELQFPMTACLEYFRVYPSPKRVVARGVTSLTLVVARKEHLGSFQVSSLLEIFPNVNSLTIRGNVDAGSAAALLVVSELAGPPDLGPDRVSVSTETLKEILKQRKLVTLDLSDMWETVVPPKFFLQAREALPLLTTLRIACPNLKAGRGFGGFGFSSFLDHATRLNDPKQYLARFLFGLGTLPNLYSLTVVCKNDPSEIMTYLPNYFSLSDSLHEITWPYLDKALARDWMKKIPNLDVLDMVNLCMGARGRDMTRACITYSPKRLPFQGTYLRVPERPAEKLVQDLENDVVTEFNIVAPYFVETDWTEVRKAQEAFRQEASSVKSKYAAKFKKSLRKCLDSISELSPTTRDLLLANAHLVSYDPKFYGFGTEVVVTPVWGFGTRGQLRFSREYHSRDRMYSTEFFDVTDVIIFLEKSTIAKCPLWQWDSFDNVSMASLESLRALVSRILGPGLRSESSQFSATSAVRLIRAFAHPLGANNDWITSHYSNLVSASGPGPTTSVLAARRKNLMARNPDVVDVTRWEWSEGQEAAGDGQEEEEEDGSARGGVRGRGRRRRRGRGRGGDPGLAELMGLMAGGGGGGGGDCVVM